MGTNVNNSNIEAKPLSIELLGRPIHIIRDKLTQIISSSCNGLISELQNWLNSQYIDIKLTSVEIYELKSTDIDKSSFSQYSHENGGSLFIHLNDSMLIKFSDRFYCTNIERRKNVITSSDKRLQERIGKLISQWIAPQEMWQVKEDDISFGIGLKAKLNVTYAGQHGVLTLIFENQLVQTLIDQLDLQTNKNLKPQFHGSLKNTPVRLNVLLCKKTMPLSDVLNLSPKDIIPIDLLSTAPVSIGNERLFSGQVAEQDGQLVLILKQDKDSLK